MTKIISCGSNTNPLFSVVDKMYFSFAYHTPLIQSSPEITTFPEYYSNT